MRWMRQYLEYLCKFDWNGSDVFKRLLPAFVTEVESVSNAVAKCVQLESLCVAGNPFTELAELE